MAEYHEWNRKGATPSDATAQKEYGISRDFISKSPKNGARGTGNRPRCPARAIDLRPLIKEKRQITRQTKRPLNLLLREQDRRDSCYLVG